MHDKLIRPFYFFFRKILWPDICIWTSWSCMCCHNYHLKLSSNKLGHRHIFAIILRIIWTETWWWSRSLLEKLIISQQVKIYPSFYRTQVFFFPCWQEPDCTQYLDTDECKSHSRPLSFRAQYNTVLISTPRPQSDFISSAFPIQIPFLFSIPPIPSIIFTQSILYELMSLINFWKVHFIKPDDFGP
jgi:hypothetical protein